MGKWTRDKGDIRNYYQAQTYETWSQDPGAAGDRMLGAHIEYKTTSGWEKVPEFKQAWFEYGQAGKLLRLNKKGMKKNVGAMQKNVGKVVVRAKEIQATNKAAAEAEAARKKAAEEAGRKKARGIGATSATGGGRGRGSKGAVYQRSILGSGKEPRKKGPREGSRG
jgi:hypothetical protein